MTPATSLNAYFVVPELRGFEKFCIGRPVEEMPRLTQRICGVCPSAHHMAAVKAADAVYHLDPPPAAKKIRELHYAAFCCADHATHIYVLSGPDFIVGPEASPAERNILGVIRKVGMELGSRVLQHLHDGHEVVSILGGRYIHPVNAIPGGVSKGLTAEDRARIEALCPEYGRVRPADDQDIRSDRPWATRPIVEMIRSGRLYPPNLLHGTGGPSITASISMTARCAWWTRRDTSSANTSRQSILIISPRQ